MTISLKTHKLLWGRSGNKCAFEDCRNDLIADETETDDESIIGDEAHIVARSKDGPRGVSDLSEDDRDKYDNLILLCRKHHKIIDDQPGLYTVEKLVGIKKIHEKWISESLTIDKEKDRDDLIYAGYIDTIASILDFENWTAWTSGIFVGEQSIVHSRLKELEGLLSFVVTRFWPNRYIELEDSILNIKAVLNDFLMVFQKHIKPSSSKLEEGDDPNEKMLYTERFYKLIYHADPRDYDRLLDEYEFHVALVEDLMLELTRAGNLLIERIRKYIAPNYRDEEGKLLITYGPTMDFSFHSLKVEYKKEEKSVKYPYPGLQRFMSDRGKRDFYFGAGESEKYLPFQ